MCGVGCWWDNLSELRKLTAPEWPRTRDPILNGSCCAPRASCSLPVNGVRETSDSLMALNVYPCTHACYINICFVASQISVTNLLPSAPGRLLMFLLALIKHALFFLVEIIAVSLRLFSLDGRTSSRGLVFLQVWKYFAEIKNRPQPKLCPIRWRDTKRSKHN